MILLIFLCMRPAKERLGYNATSSLIDWAHIQNDPCYIMSMSSFTCLRNWKDTHTKWAQLSLVDMLPRYICRPQEKLFWADFTTYCARWNGVVLSVYNNHIYPSGQIRWLYGTGYTRWHRDWVIIKHSRASTQSCEQIAPNHKWPLLPRLAKCPSKTNGRLANCRLTFLAKEATGGLDITVCSL